MGTLSGHEQKQVYIEEGLWLLVTALSTKLNVPIYKIVNDALRAKLSKHFRGKELETLTTLLTQKGSSHASKRRRKR